MKTVLVSYVVVNKQGWGFGNMVVGIQTGGKEKPHEVINKLTEDIKKKEKAKNVVVLNVVDLSFLGR